MVATRAGEHRRCSLPLHSTTLRNVVEVLYVVLRELKTVATGRERSLRSTTACGHRSDLSQGRGRSLSRRCPSRRLFRQPRSVTWLPGLLSSRCLLLGWRAIISREMMASTTLPSGSSSARCWRRRRGGRRRRRSRRRAPRLPRRPRGRGKKKESVRLLVVCGYDAVGQGFRSRSSLSRAQRCLFLLTGLECSASGAVCTRRTSPCSFFDYGSGSAMLVWLVTIGTSRYVPFWRRQAPDALHHGRYGPEGQYASCARRQPKQWLAHGWFYW